MGIYSVKNNLLDNKNIEYKNYIDNHRNLVKESFNNLKDILKKELLLSDQNMEKLYINVLNHDSSKFSPDEFDAYRKYFYPVNDNEKPKKLDDSAWHHHIMNNKHHWNYWCYVDKANDVIPIDIPDVYLAELILDWDAMSNSKGGTSLEYYENNKEKILLSDNTRLKLESVLKNIYLK